MLPLGSFFADRYRIDSEVGRGAFGIVYAAFDVREERNVAIKVLLPEAASDETLKHRLRREARLTQEMKSSHCVRMYEVAETTAGQAYIAMELLAGEELQTLLDRETVVSPARTAAIVRQILEAVGEAHDLGVVHRDLKPHNVFLCRAADGGDDVKVIDFGIAKIAGRSDGAGLAESTRLTTQGTILGTPTYMSPEQCRGGVPVPGSDFYSIGVMIYQMLTGKPPFDDANPVRVLMMHNTDAVPPLPPEIARTPLGRAAMRALEKDIGARFATAAEFAAALDAPATTSDLVDPQPQRPVSREKPGTVVGRLSQIMQVPDALRELNAQAAASAGSTSGTTGGAATGLAATGVTTPSDVSTRTPSGAGNRLIYWLALPALAAAAAAGYFLAK